MMRSMVEPIDADPPADQVRRITFVPFLSDGRCALIEDPGGPALPSGEVPFAQPRYWAAFILIGDPD